MTQAPFDDWMTDARALIAKGDLCPFTASYVDDVNLSDSGFFGMHGDLRTIR